MTEKNRLIKKEDSEVKDLSNGETDKKKVRLPDFKEVQKVKGIFRNVEYPGTGVAFSFRGGWKGPVKHFSLFDGCEYELPKEVADHLNNGCAYKTMKWLSSEGNSVNAKPLNTPSMPNYTPQVDKKIHRFMFQITG